MDAAIGARPLQVAACVAELSGGMDSASVAVSAARMLGGTLRSAGIVLAGHARTIQTKRRRLITLALGLRDESFEMSEHMPVVDLDSSMRALEHPLGEFYLEAFDALWRDAATNGCHAILTGVGGDELFPRYDADNAAEGRKKPGRLIAAENIARTMLSRRAQFAMDVEPLYCAPASIVPHTGLLAHVSRSPYMLRRGLWPVNPLCDPALVGFCHRLPVQYRVERELLRRYLHRHLGHDLFPIGYAKETFDYALPEVIAGQHDWLSEQLRECALADFGLVDMAAVRNVLRRVADTRDVTATAPLAIFLYLERFMRQTA
ncbi:asparagine synthase-related protein [Cupriavidus necator]